MIDKLKEDLEWCRTTIQLLEDLTPDQTLKAIEARADILRAIQKLEKIENGKIRS